MARHDRAPHYAEQRSAQRLVTEMMMPDAARRRAALIELLQRVHLGSEAASVLVEVHGWNVVGSLAGCENTRKA